MVRTFMWPVNYAGRPERDQGLPMYSVSLCYTGDQYQQLGGAELTHFLNPYDSSIRADMTSTRETVEPAITFLIDHFHPVTRSPHRHPNTAEVLAYGQPILAWAEQDTRTAAA